MTTPHLLLVQPVDGLTPWSGAINDNMDKIALALHNLDVRVSALESAAPGQETTVTELATFSSEGSFVLNAPNGIAAGSLPIVSFGGVIQDGASTSKRYEVQAVDGVLKKIQLLPYEVETAFSKVGSPAIQSVFSGKVLQMTSDTVSYTGAAQTVSASSVYGGSYYPAWYGADKKANTFWASGSGSSVANPQWWQVDFGSAVSFNRLSLRSRTDGWEYQAPRDFEVRASNDNMATYDVIGSAANLTWAVGETKTFVLAPVAASYKTVRLHVTSTNSTGDPIVSFSNVDLFAASEAVNATAVSGTSALSTFSPDFAVGTGDFTVEAWVNLTTHNSYSMVATTRPYDGGFTDAWTLGVNANGAVYIFTNGFAAQSADKVVPAGVWKHLAWSRSGGTLRIFVDGAQVASASVPNNFSRAQVTIGGDTNGGYNLTGAIKNFRITKAARYTSPFTPSAVNESVEDATSDSFASSTVLRVDLDALSAGRFTWRVAGALAPTAKCLVTYQV